MSIAMEPNHFVGKLLNIFKFFPSRLMKVNNNTSSVAYLAPEMLRRAGHGKAVDWYLVGVILYEMLFGSPPYYCNTR